MAADIEALIARDVANGVPERSARLKWASVLAWTASADDPVFWTNPADASAPELEASAAPIATDPSVTGPSARDAYTAAAVEDGWTPDEAEIAANAEAGMQAGSFDPRLWNAPSARAQSRAGARYVRGRRAREEAMDSSLAEAMGHNYVPPDVTGPDTVTVDGVSVPAHRLSDGQPFGGMYSLGDLRRAQEAANEERLAAMFSKSAQEDLEKYGSRQLVRYKYGPDGNIVDTEYVEPSLLSDEEAEQQRNLMARRGVETRQQRQNAALRNRPGLREYEEDAADRRAFLRRRNMLAGGSQNIASGSRGMWNQLMMLSPEEQIRQLSYALPGGAAIADVDRVKAAAAGDLAKVRVMDREVDARMAAIQAQIEQARGDRQSQSEQFQARMDADAEARRMQQEQFMAKMAQDAAEAERRFGLGSQEAEARHAALLAQIEQNKAENARMMTQFQQQSEAAAAEREARERMHYAGLETEMSKTAAILGKDRDATAAARADAAGARELQFMQSSPGLYDVMTGKADTPAAIRALKAIASQSEDTWTEDILDPTVYATLGFADSGFDAGNARRMNDELKRMAKQAELLGLDTRLNDPAYRRDLINRYGFNSGWAGGQGGWLGSLWRTMPEDLQ